MEDDAKARAAGDSTPPSSVRASERAITSDYPPVEPPHGWQFGRYELVGRLAYGGMAEIYLARESAYGLVVRYVVIKRVLPHIANDEEFIGLFMDEARVAMSLTHPHISHIYEFGRIEGSHFLAMEWVNGIALNRLIKQCLIAKRPLPLKFAVKVIASVAEALDYAHAAKSESGEPLGIIHRDVTPHNIMLSFDGTVKLLDFGIAMASTRRTDTRTGLVRGKLAYMSPQQCLAKAIDARSDIFSLGVCLYEALTARRLYKRDTDFEVCESILKDPVPSLRDVDPALPEELDDIVQRCLAKDPDDRFQRAGEVQQALAQFLAERREVVAASAMAEMLRELFADEYEHGPKLDTKTDLLNSLPRARSDGTPAVIVSSAPPTTQRVVPGRAEESDATTQEVTSSQTRTVATLVGGRMAYVFLVSSLAAVALAAFAVWSVATRSAPSAIAPGGEPPVSTPGVPASTSLREAVADEPGAIVVPDDPLKGSVWITSDPPRAAVYINGNPTGRTTPTQLPGVWPGVYRITLRKQGHETYRTRVTIEAGQVTQHAADMMTHDEAQEFYRRRAQRGEATDAAAADPSSSAEEPRRPAEGRAISASESASSP